MSRQQIQNDVNSPRYTAGEKMFKEAIESHWNCSLEKLPIDYRFDYALIKDNQIKA